MKSTQNMSYEANGPRPVDHKAAGERGQKMSDEELLNALKDIQNSHDSNPVEQAKSSAPQPDVPTPKTKGGVQSKQAAQPSDKAETDVALAGGQSPRPPVACRKASSIKLSFRTDTDMKYDINQFAIQLGCEESEAIRRLIEAGLGRTPIIITPKSPPQLLEFFAGSLKKWSSDFAIIKSRLNAPMPTTDDAELRDLVENWRKIAKQLQEQLPLLIQSSSAVADLLHCLDAEKIQRIRRHYPTLCSWIKIREAKLTRKEATAEDIEAILPVLEFLHAIRILIEDLGIIEPEEG